ncbi:MAG TPA: hypothetical protein VLC92_09995 [Rhodocyclaceae bacterium]|nr:hypothetical protein [Rhodocyclaceae bacterium]
MSLLPIPNWCRMLGWGLLASLVLHWVVFDLMRVAAWLPATSRLTVLRVKLPEDVGLVARDEVPSVATGAPVRSAMPAHISTSASARTSPEIARKPSERVLPHVLPDTTPALIQAEGLRSGQSAEATVALRLSIARSLAQSRGLPSLSQALLLMCDFDAAGRLLVVRDISGAAQPAVLVGVRRAVEQVALPPILLGQAFSLDVLLESGD